MTRIILDAISALNFRERQRLLRLVLLHTFVSIMDIASLALLLAAIHYYTQSGAAGISKVAAAFQHLQNIHFLLPLLLFLLLFILKNGLSFFAIRGQFHFIYTVASRMSADKMQEYLDGSFDEYTQLNPSVHTSRINFQPLEFCTYILSGIQQMFTEGMLTLFAVTAILLFNAKLFVLLVVILLPPVLLSAYLAKRRLNAARRHVKESNELAIQHLNEALASYVESNVFDRKQFFSGRYALSQKRLTSTLADLQITQALPPRFMELFAVLGLLGLIVVNHYASGTSMDLVNIGAFMAAAYKIIPGITRIANTSAQMRMYAYSIHAVRNLPAHSTAERQIEPINEIAFQRVSFRHSEQKGLEDFSMELTKGSFVGISSDSGKGKTTMVNLLLGFLKPKSGVIAINGQVRAEAQHKALWPVISYVKQQTFLIHDSILRNITLEHGDYDAARLNEAIRMAGLENFIDSFPEGLEKIVSDNGKNISGGQRQRIAIARAFYKEAQLLILDEPFNELDAASEQMILKLLQEMAAAGKMIILITHNRASLEYCNQLVSIHG